MTEIDLLAAATKILGHIGQSLKQVEFWEKGATCHVWKVQSECGSYALRIVDADDRVLRTEIDVFIRKAVSSKGGHVVDTLVSSDDAGYLLNGKRWSLDTFANGTHPARGNFSDLTCRQLGETLAALHDLPVEKFGSPSHIKFATVLGQIGNPVEGVKQRFENPLPQTWDAGYVHPLFRTAPDIVSEIRARLQGVSDVVKDGCAVLCHTDLHEKQMLCADGDLTALIDFGGAAILDKHWDLGCILYFQGEQNALKVFDAYSNSRASETIQLNTISLFSVAIAMHHASRSRLSGKRHRLARATQYVRQLIPG